MARGRHTATLVGTKIYFLSGATETEYLNDFFYLDMSKSFDKTNGALPFVNLTDKALEIPPNRGAATSVFGKLRDSIFLFGGDMGDFNDPLRLMYSFDTIQLKWKTVTGFQGIAPVRRMLMGVVTDNNDKIHIFGGGIVGTDLSYSSEHNTFDTFNKIWTNVENGIMGREGHTATFLSDTGEIVYIRGITHNGNDFELIDMNNLDVYNTINGRWDKRATKNPPEQRYGHTAVLTNDKRIIIFGGTQVDINLPAVKNYCAVLDTKTSEWYLGKEDPSTRAPYKEHTATLYNDYMFIAFGMVYSVDRPYSDDILIYKIGEYANITD